MGDTLTEIVYGTLGGFAWVWQQMVCQVPFEQNYFWMVTIATMVVMLLEFFFPWRTDQRFFRKDWGVDLFYLYANLFAFTVVLEAIYSVCSLIFPSEWGAPVFTSLGWGWQLILFFILQDFLQWVMHRLLHANQWLWNFHQIHHSVKEMGVASHFRYHWMENVLYKPTKLAVIALFAGVEPYMAVLVHMGGLCIGHLNHANIRLNWGPFRYVFNSPTLHLLHHSKEHLALGGVNFAISLSCWDYLFGTFAEPTDNGEIILGFEADTEIPSSVWKQLTYPFR